MKKGKELEEIDEMRESYDFGSLKGLVRGKYAKRYKEGHNIVRLDPDVAEVFHNEEAVNKALRKLIEEEKQAV